VKILELEERGGKEKMLMSKMRQAGIGEAKRAEERRKRTVDSLVVEQSADRDQDMK
jgi:hypothetical protein